MENKNLLKKKGAIYVGTGVQQISTKVFCLTEALDPLLEQGVNKVLICDSSAPLGLRYSKLIDENFEYQASEYGYEHYYNINVTKVLRAQEATSSSSCLYAHIGEKSDQSNTKTIEEQLEELGF